MTSAGGTTPSAARECLASAPGRPDFPPCRLGGLCPAQMPGLVERPYREAVFCGDDLVDRAGRLAQVPVAGERQLERVQQNHAVDAVVPDQDHGVLRMPLEDHAERVG